ncbi:alpha/beta hydrolase family protein [Coprobacter secundus]|uniref:Acetyl xylan esterase n=1 Tax=Coprobacter secundus subsp. similis TaxID=2751153 RepID=A0A7G1HQY6_9BACT|nr:alpha/beta hydrolase family protein [Coprobacter secundus]BCI62099.1 hypothetical protein Cop2CBH44_04520 [Coprobacter secundus subsp. similis]
MKSIIYWSALLSSALFMTQCANSKKITQKNDIPKERNLAYQDSYSASAYYEDLYNCAEMKYAFKGTTYKEFEAWQKEFRDKLKERLGITKLEKQLASFEVKARKIDSEDIGYAIRERWEIWTEPDVPLPFVLLLPKNKEGKLPLMITPHGHGKNTETYAGVYLSEQERIEGEVGERNVAVQAVQNGFIAIAPTSRGFGKTRTPEDKAKDVPYSCRTLLMQDLLVGRTPIGDRVWDISKLIDWALAELPVDKKNIIVSGNSGGGTTTLFAGACDTRISMSIPASYFSTFTKSIGAMYHCDCNYIPGILEYGEMADIAGLTAPRLFCALNGKKDPMFPLKEAQKAFANLKKIYTAAGVPDNCELYVGNEGHRYYKAGAWNFINKHLAK